MTTHFSLMKVIVCKTQRPVEGYFLLVVFTLKSELVYCTKSFIPSNYFFNINKRFKNDAAFIDTMYIDMHDYIDLYDNINDLISIYYYKLF